MKKIMLGILALTILLSFVACDFFVTSWGSGLERDLDSMLKNESPDDLAKLASDPNYKGDSEAAKSLLNALGTKSETEINNLSPEAKSDILDLALTATLPTDSITSIMESINENDDTDILDILVGSINEFDTTAVVTILNEPEGVDTDSLVSASVAVVAQVVKRAGNDLAVEDLFKEDEDGNLSVNEALDNEDTKAELEAVLNVFNLFKEGGERANEDPSFLGFSFSEMFGGNE